MATKRGAQETNGRGQKALVVWGISGIGGAILLAEIVTSQVFAPAIEKELDDSLQRSALLSTIQRIEQIAEGRAIAVTEISHEIKELRARQERIADKLDAVLARLPK